MTTYQMTDEDKVQSFRVLRTALYFSKRIADIDAGDAALSRALRAIPDIENINILYHIVTADGVWAARQILATSYD